MKGYNPRVCWLSLVRITVFPVKVGSMEGMVITPGSYDVVTVGNGILEDGMV